MGSILLALSQVIALNARAEIDHPAQPVRWLLLARRRAGQINWLRQRLARSLARYNLSIWNV